MNTVGDRADTWVLLRGLTRECRHWGAFPDLLRGDLAGADVITLDLPGNGRLNTIASPLRIEDMAGACRQALAQRGVRPPYRLLTMSLGAMVALAWADAHPQELRSCVLVNTSVRGLSPWHHRLRPHNLPGLMGMALGRDDLAKERTVLRLTTHHPQVPLDELLAHWVAWRQERPVSRANALRQLWAAARFRPPVKRPDVPLLLLSSAADTLVDPRCSARLAQAWGCDLRTHPSAGHDLPLDDGAWVAREVLDWLASLPDGIR